MKKLAILFTALLASQTIMAKGVEATNAYARAVVSGVTQSGAFVTLKNTDAEDKILVAASVSPKIAARTELHTHINDNGIMRMRQVTDGIVLPAHETVELKPGSFHIMFFDLKTVFRSGKKFPLTLKFKDGSTQTIKVTVKPMQTMPQNSPHHTHHQHQH